MPLAEQKRAVAWLAWGGYLLTAAVLATLILLQGDVQFGGEDGGILTHTAWQLLHGYLPYRDVAASGLPPIFLIGSHLAFALFGVQWHSFVMFTALFSVVTLLFQLSLLERLPFGRVWAWSIAVLTQCLTLVPISWWWFNQATAVAACLFATAALVFTRNPRDRYAQVAFTLTAALLMLGKANVAGLLIVLVGLICLRARELRWRMLAGYAVAGLLVLGVFAASHIALPDLLASYRLAGHRVFSPRVFLDCFWRNDQWEVEKTFLALVPAVIALGITLVQKQKDLVAISAVHSSDQRTTPATTAMLANNPVLAISAAAIVVGFVAMGTNNDLNQVELPGVLLGISVIVLTLADSWPATLRTQLRVLLAISFAALLVFGLYIGQQRLRVRAIGMRAYYEDAPLTRLTTPPFFAGVAVAPRFTRVLAQTRSLLSANGYLGHPHAPVYFGPRLLFNYAAFGLEPVPGIPLWWQLYKDKIPQTKEKVQLFQTAQYEMAIFIHRDYIFYPKSLCDYLNSEYDVVDWGELTVHFRRHAGRKFVLPALPKP